MHVLPAGPAGLPAALEIQTRCGMFRLEPGGHVVQVWRLRPRTIPPDRQRALVTHDPESGVKTVSLLGSREGRLRPLYSHRSRSGLAFGLCEGMMLEWRGSWLLYASGEGHVVLIESRSGKVIKLTQQLRRLPGGHGSVTHWSSS